MNALDAGAGLPILFIASTALAIVLFLRAAPRSRTLFWILLAWISVQAILAMNGFFLETDRMPPRMIVAIGPPLLCLIAMMSIPSAREWSRKFDLRLLTLLHIVRIPVEIGLHGLYEEGLVPQLMTFEGRNFDIISGITAPIMVFIAFYRSGINRPLLLGWNILCLLLLLNVVVHGILSVPSPFQYFAFDRPNVALLYFPFEWLPALIVPTVLFAHIAAILQLSRRPIGEPFPVDK